MSRSRKNVSHYCDHNGYSGYTKWAKRQANKTVRRSKNIANGNQYKKFFCTWNIRDYVWIEWKDIQYVEDDWVEGYKKGFRK